MKAMTLSDLISSKSALLQLFGISIFVSIFVGFATEQLLSVIGLGAMVPFLYLFTMASSDEQNGWERFRLTMPLSRKQVVYGRYASFLIVLIASAVAALITALAAGGVAQLLPEGLAADAIRLDAWSVPELLAVTLLVELVILVGAAISLPVIMKFGMTKGARFVPIIVVIALTGAVGLFGSNADLLHLDQLLASGESIALLLAGITVVSIALFCASALLSVRLYETREF